MDRWIDRSRYSEMHEGKKVLEAVYRMQQAQSRKKCSKEDCVVEADILPLEVYARVYYEDAKEVEFFHKPCFEEEFQDVRR